MINYELEELNILIIKSLGLGKNKAEENKTKGKQNRKRHIL